MRDLPGIHQMHMTFDKDLHGQILPNCSVFSQEHFGDAIMNLVLLASVVILIFPTMNWTRLSGEFCRQPPNLGGIWFEEPCSAEDYLCREGE